MEEIKIVENRTTIEKRNPLDVHPSSTVAPPMAQMTQACIFQMSRLLTILINKPWLCHGKQIGRGSLKNLTVRVTNMRNQEMQNKPQ